MTDLELAWAEEHHRLARLAYARIQQLHDDAEKVYHQAYIHLAKQRHKQWRSNERSTIMRQANKTPPEGAANTKRGLTPKPERRGYDKS